MTLVKERIKFKSTSSPDASPALRPCCTPWSSRTASKSFWASDEETCFCSFLRYRERNGWSTNAACTASRWRKPSRSCKSSTLTTSEARSGCTRSCSSWSEACRKRRRVQEGQIGDKDCAILRRGTRTSRAWTCPYPDTRSRSLSRQSWHVSYKARRASSSGERTPSGCGYWRPGWPWSRTPGTWTFPHSLVWRVSAYSTFWAWTLILSTASPRPLLLPTPISSLAASFSVPALQEKCCCFARSRSAEIYFRILPSFCSPHLQQLEER